VSLGQIGSDEESIRHERRSENERPRPVGALKESRKNHSLEETKMQTKMPIRAAPYRHQQEAYGFTCRLFEGGDANHSISGRGAALLMEM